MLRGTPVVAVAQDEVLSSLLFLYREAVGQDVDLASHAMHAERPKRLARSPQDTSPLASLNLTFQAI